MFSVHRNWICIGAALSLFIFFVGFLAVMKFPYADERWRQEELTRSAASGGSSSLPFLHPSNSPPLALQVVVADVAGESIIGVTRTRA